MPRKQHNIHYIYKTTCLVTGRYYIGMHSTSNLEDGYLGSGKRLRHSIRKHGKESHVKEILEFCESRELLVEREKQIITQEHLCDNNCMNIMSGGTGGLLSIEHVSLAGKIGGSIQKEKLKIENEYRITVLNTLKKNVIQAHQNGKYKHGYFKGKFHSDETKKMMSDSHKLNSAGKSNSQYGTCWITNGTENKKIKKDSDIPAGWYKGRKIK